MAHIELGLAALLLGIAFVCDVRAMRIPNKLTLTFFASGLIYHLSSEGLSGVIFSVIGVLAGVLPLIALYMLKGIGAGDVKLFGALGAIVGAALSMQVLMYSILYGGLFGIVLLVLNQTFAKRIVAFAVSLFALPRNLHTDGFMTLKKNGLRFPFMIAVVPGAITTCCFMREWPFNG
ncbi:prepilin peptidase CpaA [Paenibacillus sp. CF384]|nr:prepilin peptidase CpaA [Paenibacillus sp. CF384]